MTPTKTKTTTKRVKLPPNPFIHEVLELACKQRSKAKKVEILQEYRDDSITAVLIWNFDDTVESAIPAGQVPYKENEVPVGTDHTSLRREWTNLYNFVEGGNANLNGMRREVMFINLLQGLHPKEAELLVYVKDKKLTDLYNIPLDIVKAAYPDVQWGGRV